MCVKLGIAKFQPSSARQTFSKWRVNEGGVEKNCVFQRKTGLISETVRDIAKVIIYH